MLALLLQQMYTHRIHVLIDNMCSRNHVRPAGPVMVVQMVVHPGTQVSPSLAPLAKRARWS